MIYIGIDNGSSGSIAVLSKDGKVLLNVKTPIKEVLSYTKTVKYLKRLDFKSTKDLLSRFRNYECKCLIERPLVNGKMFNGSVCASRVDEATRIVLEELEIPYEYTDSKAWQKKLLPAGVVGTPNLKKAAKSVAERLFVGQDILTKQGDHDALLIAEYLRRKEVGYFKRENNG